MKDFITYLMFDNLSKEELLEEFKNNVKEHKKTFTLTPNLDFLRLSYKDSFFRRIINDADYSLIDGKPIIWLAKLTHKKKIFKYKISGSDFSTDLLNIANENYFSIILFGGKEGIAEKAKEKIMEKYPNIDVRLAICPDFGYENDNDKCLEYIKEINDAKGDIVFLCTGSPKTEKFIYKYKDLFNDATYLSVGATIDFWAGNIKRAPKWMSKVGLEWFYRLTKDFRRLFKRYLLDFLFLLKIILICLFKKKKIQKLRGE